MSNDTPKLPLSLVVLATIAVLASVLITVNMQHDHDTSMASAIVAAGGLIGLGIAARR